MSTIEAVLWLALNIYFEARSEPLQGQLAVSHVVLNRVEQRHLTVKEVILQPYQFSWTFQEDSYWPKNKVVFASCVKVAIKAMNEPDFTFGATNYHLKSIHPDWAKNMTYVGSWGSHKFYKEDNGKK